MIDMSFGLHEMKIENLFQFLQARGFHHLGQMLQEQVLAIPSVFQSALEEIRQVVQ